MKKTLIITFASVFVAILLIVLLAKACSSSSSDKEACDCNCIKNGTCSGDCKDICKASPLNISIFLDLSDRLTKVSNSMSQKDKDLSLIKSIEDYFYDKQWKEKLRNGDAMTIFFYPTPQVANVNQIAQDLTIDTKLSKRSDISKVKEKLKTFRNVWNNDLNNIYTSTLQSKNWIGSDIWGFFDNQVDVQCIKKDYRNILVILTDGYIYDKNNMINKGDETSYLLEKTLSNPKAKLIATRTDLKDLEVLVLEVNPSHPQDFTHMKNIMEDWFKRMGVKHYRIAQTDIPINTEKVISKFIEEK